MAVIAGAVVINTGKNCESENKKYIYSTAFCGHNVIEKDAEISLLLKRSPHYAEMWT